MSEKRPSTRSSARNRLDAIEKDEDSEKCGSVESADESQSKPKSSRSARNTLNQSMSSTTSTTNEIKTRSRNRQSLFNMDNDSTPKKRHASNNTNTDTSLVAVNIDTNSNEDSNSNFSTSVTTSEPASKSVKKLKNKLDRSSKTTPVKIQPPNNDENQQKCSLNEQCGSTGHISGKYETHLTLDTCPFYFGMNKNECIERRVSLDKNLNELNEKLQRLNDINKRLRASTSAQTVQVQMPSKEQNEYFKQIDKQRIKHEDQQMDVDVTDASIKQNDDLSDDSVSKLKVLQVDDLNVSKYDLDLFKDIVQLHADLQEPQPLTLGQNVSKLIQFGDYEIETWYKSPYPDDYWQLSKIYLCEFCLKYMKTSSVLRRHTEKCIWKHPPGKEIYRKNNLSFWEVDGKSNKIYCQNLCLLSKLFLDHKTLYFDVEPFLFYVLTSYNINKGTFNMIGYFSKEKHSIMNFNLSCILTLPQYMKQGFGKLLIDFSYLLSKIEEKIGSPERPLSDLGLVSYRNYWKAKLLSYLNNFIVNDEISVKDVSHETAIHPNDIISTFQFLGLVKYWKGKHVILKDEDLINKQLQKWSSNLQVDETCLKWTPYVINKIDTTNPQLLNKLTSCV